MIGIQYDHNYIYRYIGPLTSIDNFSYSFPHSDIANISWIPPYTLPGIDIIGYNITFTTTNNTTMTTVSDIFTSSNYYSLYKAQCEKIIFAVTGYNGLNGANGSTLLSKFCITIHLSQCQSQVSFMYVVPIDSGDIYFTVEASSLKTQEVILLTNINVSFNPYQCY